MWNSQIYINNVVLHRKIAIPVINQVPIPSRNLVLYIRLIFFWCYYYCFTKWFEHKAINANTIPQNKIKKKKHWEDDNNNYDCTGVTKHKTRRYYYIKRLLAAGWWLQYRAKICFFIDKCDNYIKLYMNLVCWK